MLPSQLSDETMENDNFSLRSESFPLGMIGCYDLGEIFYSTI